MTVLFQGLAGWGSVMLYMFGSSLPIQRSFFYLRKGKILVPSKGKNGKVVFSAEDILQSFSDI